MSDRVFIAAPGGFGPCLPAEIVAQGFSLAALPFAFSADGKGLLIPAGTDAAVQARIAALVAAHDPTKLPVDLASYAKAAHAALRDGGVTISGMRIKTDSESRGLIDGAYALSQAQPNTAIDFKAASGWVTIDAATMQTVAVAVGKWVQACYSAYRQVDGKVADGTFTAPSQIDAAFAAVTLPA